MALIQKTFQVISNYEVHYTRPPSLFGVAIVNSPHGKQAAYVAEQCGKQFIVLDSAAGKKYDYVSDT
jgi:hypothetical protein